MPFCSDPVCSVFCSGLRELRRGVRRPIARGRTNNEFENLAGVAVGLAVGEQREHGPRREQRLDQRRT